MPFWPKLFGSVTTSSTAVLKATRALTKSVPAVLKFVSKALHGLWTFGFVVTPRVLPDAPEDTLSCSQL